MRAKKPDDSCMCFHQNMFSFRDQNQFKRSHFDNFEERSNAIWVGIRSTCRSRCRDNFEEQDDHPSIAGWFQDIFITFLSCFCLFLLFYFASHPIWDDDYTCYTPGTPFSILFLSEWPRFGPSQGFELSRLGPRHGWVFVGQQRGKFCWKDVSQQNLFDWIDVSFCSSHRLWFSLSLFLFTDFLMNPI